MKKNLCAMMLAGCVLLGLTACSNYEPLISRDGAATGSAASGNSVTSVVSGGAVESNSKDKEKGKTTSRLSRWYRNCNSRKMYVSCWQLKDNACHVVQCNLNGGGEKVLKTKADNILWVTDEVIYIEADGKIYQIPLRHEGGKKESLDDAEKKCVISDACYDGCLVTLVCMDDNEIYYLNKKKQMIQYDIVSGKSRKIKMSSTLGTAFEDGGAEVTMTENKVFIDGGDVVCCIHRDTLELETIFSGGGDCEYTAYQEESDKFFFTCINLDGKESWQTELVVYDGRTTRRVASAKEIKEVLFEYWGLDKKEGKNYELVCYYLYAGGGNIYLEYSLDRDDSVENCGMLVYDKDGKLHEEEKLAEQIRKHSSDKSDYSYDVYGVEDDCLYILEDQADADHVLSYNLVTGEMKKISSNEVYMLRDGDYNKNEF